jgi:adenylate cyclase
MTAASSSPAAFGRDVFVSYASQDAAVANSIVEAVEKAGLRCWIAPRDVVPGSLYADGIVRAINGAKLFVLVLSEHAVASPHVGKEIERASSKGKPVIALHTDNAPLTPAFEYFLSESHWIDLSPGGAGAATAKLVESVRRHVHPSAVSVAPVQSHATASGCPETSAPAAVVGDKSIAVLPFTDMSENRNQEYFADGMAEEIINLLVKIPGLTVIGRMSSFQFKGRNEDLRTIGTKLNAGHLLEGSVRKSGDRVRITAQLISTRTGTHEWSDTYDRQVGDVLKLQDAIAAAVARELQLTVTSGQLNSRSTVKNAEAYDLILRGRRAADRWDRKGLDQAVTLLKQALERDGTSADAAAELAFAYYRQGTDGSWASAAPFELAGRAAAIALKLDPKNALAHYVRGKTYIVYDWDWAAAEREFQQVATLAPGSADALNGRSRLSLALGRWDDALKQVEGALSLDPQDPNTFHVLTLVQMRRGHLAEAETAMRRALEIRPSYGWGRFYIGLVLLARGDRGSALLEMQQEMNDEARQSGLAMTYYALGRMEDSDALLASMRKEHADDYAFSIANVYAFRGQLDETIYWLERAYAQRDPQLCYLKPELEQRAFLADERYKAFLRKMNLPE